MEKNKILRLLKKRNIEENNYAKKENNYGYDINSSDKNSKLKFNGNDYFIKGSEILRKKQLKKIQINAEKNENHNSNLRNNPNEKEKITMNNQDIKYKLKYPIKINKLEKKNNDNDYDSKVKKLNVKKNIDKFIDNNDESSSEGNNQFSKKYINELLFLNVPKKIYDSINKNNLENKNVIDDEKKNFNTIIRKNKDITIQSLRDLLRIRRFEKNNQRIQLASINYDEKSDNSSDSYTDQYSAKSIGYKINSLRENVKINMLKINLIFFYETRSEENVNLYNNLKLRVLGGYYGCTDVKIFKKLLKKIEQTNSPFIVISIGSSFEKIEKYCNRFNCVKHIILFCMKTDYYHNKHLENKKILLITKDTMEVYDILSSASQQFNNYDKNLKKLISDTQLISLNEYEEYYFINHKILSFFFIDDYKPLNFSKDYLVKVFNFIDKETDDTDYDDENKKLNLKMKLRKLVDSENFLKDSLEFYTNESNFIYILNKVIRNIERGATRLSFLIGPMYYNMIRYLTIENPSLKLTEDATLYRNIDIKDYDLNLYSMAEGTIICFPSFTSTSYTNEFIPTANALETNHIGNNDKIRLEMVIYYKHDFKNAPQGMILKDFSVNQSEQEVLLFPFTFFRVGTLEEVNKNFYRLYLTIINRNDILEFELKKGKRVILNSNDFLTIA